MKNEHKNTRKRLFEVLLILPVIAITLLVMNSCGNNKSGDNTLAGLAPPPPPPPPVAPDADSVYLNVDELPLFPGGESALLDWVGKNIKYPDEAKKNNITGKVIVRFVVGKDGSVSNVLIADGVNPELDAEAVRVISSLPQFEKPAIVNENPVSVQFMLPITFKLN